jgi:hypothetical protein
MPSMSRAQHKMMTAVANNPKFAKKTGIPQSVGEEFMKADKKVMKYLKGGMTSKRPPISQEDIDRMMMEGESEYQSTLSDEDREKRQKIVKEEDMKKKMAPKKSKMMMEDGMPKGYKAGGKMKMVEKGGKEVPFFAADGQGKMAKGGKVRGAGCAKKGVRPCKMM